MTKILRYNSGAPWEGRVGYSRAVKAGPIVEVAGTMAVDENGTVVCPGDAFGQAAYIMQKIEKALAQFDATLANVTRTRMYVTDIGQWEAIGRAHAEFFAAAPPAATMVEVKSLIDPQLVVEIEVTAYVG